jgi:hypothetical protein
MGVMAIRIAGSSVISVRTKRMVQGVESEGCSYHRTAQGPPQAREDCVPETRAPTPRRPVPPEAAPAAETARWVPESQRMEEKAPAPARSLPALRQGRIALPRSRQCLRGAHTAGMKAVDDQKRNHTIAQARLVIMPIVRCYTERTFMKMGANRRKEEGKSTKTEKALPALPCAACRDAQRRRHHGRDERRAGAHRRRSRSVMAASRP